MLKAIAQIVCRTIFFNFKGTARPIFPLDNSSASALDNPHAALFDFELFFQTYKQTPCIQSSLVSISKNGLLSMNFNHTDIIALGVMIRNANVQSSCKPCHFMYKRIVYARLETG
jgi:hypothetical protein